MFNTSSISGITLESAGLIALADLSTVAVRMALTGTASYLDDLVLAPGMHQQQSAVKINDGELPDTGSMTSEYVFRVENPATVSYLRHIGRTGKLVTAEVSLKPTRNCNPFPNRFCNLDLSPRNNPFFVSGIRTTLLYVTDWWAVAVLGMLVLARLINVVVIKRRSEEGWKGEKEDGNGDLLIVLSQDRWVRLKGTINDLKAVTAGCWLRGQTSEESFAVAFATLLVYASAALAGNATTCLQMFGRVMRCTGGPKGYDKRLDMVEELIRETGKTGWAVSMQLILEDEANAVLKEPKYSDDAKGSDIPVDGDSVSTANLGSLVLEV
ncbi:hypothetical protein EDD85DRAFT_961179 [Armillaria nabsnona]|nr:hypothetical protein EDD85DRAFT_961179 [Armillaria nabsnona]